MIFWELQEACELSLMSSWAVAVFPELEPYRANKWSFVPEDLAANVLRYFGKEVVKRANEQWC